MSEKFNTIEKTDEKSKIHKKKIGKIVVSSAVASTIFLTPIAPIIENGKLVGIEQKTTEAATLAEVGILENTNVGANLSNVNGSGPYNLDLSLTGTGVADVGLADPNAVALFHAPDLAGDLDAGAASVRVEILPVTLDDLPAVGDLINGLTSTLTDAVSGIVGSVNDLLGLVPDGLLEVNGLEELQSAVNALTNLEGAVTDLLVYEDTITPTVNNENGTITVDFSDGIDNHLDTAVEDVVLQLLNDVIGAADALEVNLLGDVPIVGDLVNGLINSVLDAATGTILPAVENAVTEITTGAVDLTGNLAAAQVIGNTTVEVPATVARDTTASGEVPVSGAGVGTTTIDVGLLNTLNTETAVTIPETDTTAPEITPIENVTAVENASIADIGVQTNEPSDIVVDGLPEGLAYDPETETISGTPVVSDWGETEEERASEILVTATDEAGNTSEEPFTITVQRDTDGDGDPDITDSDDDNDDFTDEEEAEAGTDPKDETDIPDTVAPVITPIEGVTAVEGTPIDDIAIETNEASDIVVDGLPEGLVYDPETETIGGTPVVSDWGETEEERASEILVTATDEAGNTSEEPFTITVQRDTDGDGDPDITDSDDDNDDFTDEEEAEAGTDPKDETDIPDTVAPVITPIEGVTAVEGTPIDDIAIETNEASDIVVDNLPEGVTYDSEAGIITGTPEISDWGEVEEERPYDVVVTATDGAGNTSEEPFTITVQRDTDGDGDPDATDPDDDNDDFTDEEEAEAGTNPKDETDIPDTEAPVITPIEEVTAIENTPITDIVIETNEPSEITVDELPDGLAYDPETETISGTPVVNDWGEAEEERLFDVTVNATDEAGNSSDANFEIVIQRDTDGDGDSDVTDPDDDNDGVSDEDENEAGTDPKDDTDTPEEVDTEAPIITPIEGVMAIENASIADIVVETNEPSDIVVDGLPEGLVYNPETETISGTPVIADWGEVEEERLFDVTVNATDDAGNSSEKNFGLTVQRDTDSDGISDVEDTDDDNDGSTDEEENEAGTDPKDDGSIPATPLEPSQPIDSANDANDSDDGDDGLDTEAPIITPIPDVSAEDNEPIEDIVIETNEPSAIVVDGLPDGITYNSDAGIISGTPVVDDWAEDETERGYTVTVSAEDEAGNTSSATFDLTLDRGLSGLGDPTDSDDADGENNAGDGSEEEQSGLPETGEAENSFTGFFGVALASIGALLLAWNEKGKELIDKLKKD